MRQSLASSTSLAAIPAMKWQTVFDWGAAGIEPAAFDNTSRAKRPSGLRTYSGTYPARVQFWHKGRCRASRVAANQKLAHNVVFGSDNRIRMNPLGSGIEVNSAMRVTLGLNPGGTFCAM